MNRKIDIKNMLSEIKNLADRESDLEQKLVLFQFLASCYWHNYSNTYSNREIEDTLKSISNTIIDFNLPEQADSRSVLHVLTEAYSTGGHTRVAVNWIKAFPDFKHTVLLNDQINNIPDLLLKVLESCGGNIVLNKSESLIEKAKFLVSAASKFEYVVLYHHPHDIVPLLAFGTDKYSRPTYFYNHADHLWGCGYSVCDKVLELRSSGKIFTNNCRGVPQKNISVVGIPVEFPVIDNITENHADKRIVSMASRNKYTPVENYSFPVFVDKLLSSDMNVSFDFIGVDKDDEVWRGISQKFPNRLNFWGQLPKEKAHSVMKGAALYIDSFPIPSFTSLIEAASLGIPCLSLNTPIATPDSFEDIVVSTIDELIERSIAVLNYSSSEKRTFVRNIQLRMIEYHGIENFCEKVLKSCSVESHFPIKLLNDMDCDNSYSDFIYDVMGQDHFIFDSVIFDRIDWLNKQRIKIISEQNSLCGNTKSISKNETLEEVIEGGRNYVQLYIRTGYNAGYSEKDSICLPLSVSNQYAFDVSEYVEIKAIRFDPGIYPARVKILSAYIEDINGVKYPLLFSAHNGIENKFEIDFIHTDSQLVFNINQKDNTAFKTVVIQAMINPYSKKELSLICEKLSNKKLKLRNFKLRIICKFRSIAKFINTFTVKLLKG